jgi:hypothetical protein
MEKFPRKGAQVLSALGYAETDVVVSATAVVMVIERCILLNGSKRSLSHPMMKEPRVSIYLGPSTFLCPVCPVMGYALRLLAKRFHPSATASKRISIEVAVRASMHHSQHLLVLH